MKPPVLHILGVDGWLCNLSEDGSNWPEKYMDDEVARFLEFCEVCENEFVFKHGQEKMDAKKAWMRRDKSQESPLCSCGCHPEQTQSAKRVIEHTPTMVRVRKTLRMYLNT